MSVPKHTTPPPAEYHLYRAHQRHQGSQGNGQRLPDETPAWINDVRSERGAPPEYNMRAKKTMAYKKKFDPPLPDTPITDRVYFFTRAKCWDCDGDGKSGALLYRCHVCGVHYTWAQIELRAEAAGKDVRDPRTGAYWLPCSDRCGRMASSRFYGIHEPCPTCGGNGYLDEPRSIGAVAQHIYEYVIRMLGINDATMPTPAQFAAGFAGSEPTAPTPPSAPLEHPAVRIPERFTPHVSPLSPDELKEF